LLALPYSRYDPNYRSSLFLIAVDATSGFTVRGEIDHDTIVTDICEQQQPCFAFASMERGVFIDEMKRNTKSSGNIPCTASPLPVRSAVRHFGEDFNK